MSFIKEFREFAVKGNAIDQAVFCNINNKRIPGTPYLDVGKVTGCK